MFDPHQPEAMAQKMEEALTDTAFYQALKTHALSQAASFSWDKSAKTAWAAFEKLLESVEDRQVASPEASQLLPAVAQLLAQPGNSADLLVLSQAMARNQQNAKPQLLVDVSELIVKDAKTGIQRVVRSILHEWLSHPPDAYEVRAVYATTEKLGYRYADQFVQNFMGSTSANTLDTDAAIDYALGDIFLGLDMQPQVQTYQSPFYQSLRNQGVDVRFVLYDLLPITMPQFFPEGAEANHYRWVSVIAKTDGVICISKAVASEFEQWCQKNGPKKLPHIDWFQMGADLESATSTEGLPADASATLDKLAMRPTFLVVGTLEPRKGHSQVLDAANDLLKEQLDFNLVFVGKQGWKVEKLIKDLQLHPQLGQRIFWLQGISDEYLARVYEQSDCLIAPSFGEGFGLPLIEAAQRSLPIIARDIPIFREVAGENAYFFDREKSGALTLALNEWLKMHEDVSHPTSKAMHWITWSESAQQLINKIMR